MKEVILVGVSWQKDINEDLKLDRCLLHPLITGVSAQKAVCRL